MEEQCNLKI